MTLFGPPPWQGHPVEEEIPLLQQRLATVLNNPDATVENLRAEVAFFAERAIKLTRTQEKLIRISDSMQAMMSEQRNELEKSNQLKNTLFSIIAHDLRGPYGTVLNGMELLRDHERFLDAHERQELLSKILSTGRNLQDLFEDLLQWANLQMQGEKPSPSPVFIRDALEHAVTLLAPAMTAKAIQARVLAEDTLLTFVDPRMLDTVLRNLLANAIKFSHRGGEIRLRAEATGEGVKVTVADDGIGLDPRTRDKLFNIGVKSSTPGTEKEPGTGLGLIICQELLTLHRSRCEVTSQPGQGAAFHFVLPDLHAPDR